jgi:hypothetical protein
MDRGVDWGAGNSQHSQCSLCDRGGISAAHAPVVPERTYGKEKVYGSIP